MSTIPSFPGPNRSSFRPHPAREYPAQLPPGPRRQAPSSAQATPKQVAYPMHSPCIPLAYPVQVIGYKLAARWLSVSSPQADRTNSPAGCPKGRISAGITSRHEPRSALEQLDGSGRRDGSRPRPVPVHRSAGHQYPKPLLPRPLTVTDTKFAQLPQISCAQSIRLFAIGYRLLLVAAMPRCVLLAVTP